MKHPILTTLTLIAFAGCSQQPQPPALSLQEAAVRGDLAAIQQHVTARSDLDAREPTDGSTPLIAAAAFGQTAAAKALIEAGADVNLANNDGSTALHTAAFLCRAEIVKALLAAGADREIRNQAGSTALESVEFPFEAVKPVYDLVGAALGPLGLKLDYERIQAARPEIAALLKGEQP
ncbi:MAG: ankyrin repeat domain-containing protein [Verrucomicrobiales bacterium]|nr:ankyrin repeat domain-containing protein [Verrucomicrobiales bacterium]MCP5526222.1 ankyrin repeat domain-containing protein [Verrucomicrobiales bacterium]